MKKFWKIFLISLGSLLLLVLLVVAVALWLVFTPARLTPIVGKQIDKFITCPASIDRVELTFFSSFPRLGLQADGVQVINPVPGAPCDTLLRLDRLNAVVDVKAFLKRDELILSDIVLKDGVACLYSDSQGNVNYDILNLAPSSEPEPEEGGLTISYIDADQITLKNIDVRYVDDAMKMDASVRGLSSVVKATILGDDINARLVSEPFDIDFSMGHPDSLMQASVRGVALAADAAMTSVRADADLKLSPFSLTFAYAGEEYLKEARVELSAKASADPSARSAEIRGGILRLNDLGLALDGSVRNDTLRGLDMDLKYSFSEWPVSSVLALVPASMAHYLDGIDVSGKISSEGTAVGLYGEGSMPMLDLRLVFDEGRVAYPEMLPWPLSGVFADLDVHTDLQDDAVSTVKVNDIRARAPKSSLRASGTVSRLFSDPRANLVADVNADLADARPFIPDSLDVTASGKVSGRLRADVRMSQLEKMELEKMKVSGSLLLSNLDAAYDTITVKTPSAKLDFSLPNSKPVSRQATFAELSLASDDLGMTMGAGTSAGLKGARLSVETSDIRDTLNIPAVTCGFSFSELHAAMDSMKVAVYEPAGKLSLEPMRRRAGVPRIGVEYRSTFLEADLGAGKMISDSIDIRATVRYDESKDNVWEMLMPRGHISASNAMADIDMLAYPLELPSLEMDFNPREWSIQRANVKLGDSDFRLSGRVENIIQYFRGDSLLRGELDFRSPLTDITQLMALTSGAGTDEEYDGDPDDFSGPYMVPHGMDVTLHVNIEKALWYDEPLNDIRGDLYVRDGDLVLDNLTLTSAATDAQLFMIYRTPRRNHLFAGASIHLLDIEFRDLLNMVPDLDSMMPMLRSFDGKGEFHFAVETYMDSTYRLKPSTLLAEGSVTGTDLTLRDDEVFSKIARFLKYRKEGVIRVDSLAAEFTIFRDEIDIYPFLIVLDRYKAVVGGRHNLDMSFDYNISLVQSPIPFRVAVTVYGDIDDLRFKLAKSRYPDFYRPARRRNVESKELQLRQVIRNALTRKVVLPSTPE